MQSGEKIDIPNAFKKKAAKLPKEAASFAVLLRVEIRSTLLQRCQEGIEEALLGDLGVLQQPLAISSGGSPGGVAGENELGKG